MNSHALFTQRSPRRLFFFAAIPGAVSMLASALYQLVDGIFVGQFLGETAFAALNLAMPFTIINFALGVIGLMCVVIIIIGGVTYATSQGDAGKVSKATKTLLYGVVGLVVCLLAFAIVNFVLTGISGTGA